VLRGRVSKPARHSGDRRSGYYNVDALLGRPFVNVFLIGFARADEIPGGAALGV